LLLGHRSFLPRVKGPRDVRLSARDSLLIAGLIASVFLSAHDDAATPTAPGGPLDQTVTLAAGQTAAVTPTLTIRFDHVETDSRCPVDAVCVWAGEAIVVLSAHVLNEADEDLALRITGGQGSTASHGGYTLQLSRLEPAPLAGRAILQNEYIATVRITHK
jgi:hypothetical protein